MAHNTDVMPSSEEGKMKDNVAQTINMGMRGIGLALAHEVGIIRNLTSSETPRTSQEIAESTNLKERYVRELLNSLVCSHIVQAERNQDGSVLYFIPKEHWPAFEPQNTAFLGIISSAAVRFQDMIKCFQRDGPYGLPYHTYEITDKANARVGESKLDGEIQLMLERVPNLRDQLESGIDVIEVGSGCALLISEFARRFPNSRFTGSEYTNDGVENIRHHITSQNLKNLIAVRLDILDVADDHCSRYDFAFTSDVIHDLPDAEGGLAGMWKLVKPGHHVAIIEIGTSNDVMVNRELPVMGGLYCGSLFHCVPQAYQSSTSDPLGCCWGIDVAKAYIKKQGLKIVTEHQYGGIFILFVCLKE